MEENTMVETAETQPEVEAETTESAVEETVVEETQTTETETAPPAEASPLIPVKYNKQMRSLSRDEAVTYAQKGMKYDSLSPILESLKYVAASEGKTLAEFVQAIRDHHDESALAALVDRCGGNEEIARELFEVQKGKHQAAYENLLKSEQDAENETEEALTKRLADELAALREEFPEVTEYGKLPAAVIHEAEEKGISLLDSYLRYQHREQRKAETAQNQQAAAAKASAGAQASAGGNEGTDPAINALMKGIWG
ncbi:MAG: hypothetical protein IJO59_01570 [Clostridia bacterium]|nr:hypothetical protein [Clostridia bacterium]